MTAKPPVRRMPTLPPSHPVGRTITRILLGFARIELVDRSMTLAAQMFTSVLPVLIAIGTFVDDSDLTRSLRDRLSIDAAGLPASDMQMTSHTATFGVLGVFMVVIGGTSFARALGRMYGRAWDSPKIGVSQAWRWFAVLFTVASSIVVVTWIQSVGQPFLTVAAQWSVWTCVWALCPRLLTIGAVPGHVLWATGAITATLLSVIDVGGRVYMPRAVASSAAHFGVLGIVFTIIGWLFVVAVALVASPVIADAVMPVYPDRGTGRRAADATPASNE
ncbi:MAG: hypothetical protein WAX14_02605 [Rhodococcus sp. (in: high G+C Gram-positive bacteria)]|uniref:hypothetical protein n=1 Tax=Rhodococcus sp. TaxID=1831 RepID=UPI003BB5D007